MNKTLLYVFFIIGILSCQEEIAVEIKSPKSTIIALGHGGMGVGSTYPLNSFESLLKCLNLGMDGIEIDVQLTKDSVLVAFHDRELSNETNLIGQINTKTWEEIKNASYNKTPYFNYSVISLNQLFSNINNRKNYNYSLDCKIYPYTQNRKAFYSTFSNAIILLIKKFQLQNNIYIESIDGHFLKTLKKKAPDYSLFYNASSFNVGLETSLSEGFSGVSIQFQNITKEQIGRARNLNQMVSVYNIKSESDNKDAISKNPDIIQTDKVKNLLKLLKP